MCRGLRAHTSCQLITFLKHQCCIFITALGLAFQTLCIFDTFKGSGTLCFVPSAVVKKVLKVARPHYSAAKV